jgi:hypothetical protein
MGQVKYVAIAHLFEGANKREWHVAQVKEDNEEWAKKLCEELKWTPPTSKRHYSIQ